MGETLQSKIDKAVRDLADVEPTELHKHLPSEPLTQGESDKLNQLLKDETRRESGQSSN